jgi:hypothetical protein
MNLQRMLKKQLMRLEEARRELRRQREAARGKDDSADSKPSEDAKMSSSDAASAAGIDSSDTSKGMFMNEIKKGKMVFAILT